MRGEEGEKSNQYLIRIRFRGFAARVVAERRWHPSQEVIPVKPDGSEIDLVLRLSALEDITRWILGYGSFAKVLEPQELRERVASELREASQQYPFEN